MRKVAALKEALPRDRNDVSLSVAAKQTRSDTNRQFPQYPKMAIEEFDDVTQERFIEEDREAWNSICTILLGIISVGLVLACLAVYLVS